jgi:hypothetical protein
MHGETVKIIFKEFLYDFHEKNRPKFHVDITSEINEKIKLV